MTGCPELSAHPSPGGTNVDSDDLPVDGSSTAPRRCRPAKGALSPPLTSAAPQVQPKLAPWNFVSADVLGLQKIADGVSWAASAQITNATRFATAWENFAGKTAADVIRVSAGWENSAAKVLADAVRIPSGVEDLLRTSSMWVDSTRMLDGVGQQLSAFSSMLMSQSEQVLGLVASLAHWAQGGMDLLREASLRAVRVAAAFSKRVYFAVLAAQDAAMRGDWAAVERFFKQWMDLPRSGWNARLQAGSDVLLDIDLTMFGPETAFELVELIEKETNRHFRRGRRMLDDTQLNHRRVVSLDKLSVVVGLEAVPGLPTVPSAEHRALAALNEFDDPRLEVLIGGLTPQEARIAWARGFTNSWREAALACASPSSEAERVRDKLARRLKQMNTMPHRSTPLLGR